VALIALAAVPAVSACGGEEDCCDDLESYFERLDEIDDDTKSEFEDFNRDLDETFAGSTGLTEQSRADLVAAFERGAEILAGVVDDLEEIEPPAAVAEAHREAIAGYNEFRQSFSVLASRVPNIVTGADLVQAITGQADAGQRANDACDALQRIADDNQITVTLDCGIEQP
jgi:hypothetical protein